MTDFILIRNNFFKNNVSKIQKTKYLNMNINWSFSDFEDILNKPNFITYLQNSFKLNFSYLMIDAIETKIDQIRNLFKKTNTSCIDYLLKTNNTNFIEINYKKFLLTSYTLLRDFINQIFINWIFNDALNNHWIEFNKTYDNNLMFNYQFERLELDFQKNLFNIIKAINKKINDPVIRILISAYIEDINNKQTYLNQIHKNLK
ncbi:hypothetical protein V2P57_03025 [Mycoplasma mycoides subsp. mycoides]|uniref:Uncharacterized protein n=2 Tax=Mycoplasma mycoides subsp. mycoides TaxID=2103 RepID=Q6MT16_MYCMS|nr:hypothetical protein [Mycoplasma mycoides]CAE77220.1 Hypothetical protein MSC_0597 [Mycoplasma mycoides subsp. mycoides SC str. PG1]AIZ55454.1 hypothetical protein mycmycITA_00631 [Mycoplasma mycoides subsp. mycoides]AMK56519.1 hypothetical protein MSCT144_06180 [Mycoplasma mycoides subsp. mycoides]KJQ45649.1 hypothetical protein TS59_0653 [Mycoplasma mycoides subsp. mycoides]KJQ46747.1 hypothetical protein TS60_0673 [Mycoplasma mycoides subsp. mycoides]